MKEKEEAEENKCNNSYISESIGRARMVQQFWNRRRRRRRRRRSTVLCIRVGMSPFSGPFVEIALHLLVSSVTYNSW